MPRERPVIQAAPTDRDLRAVTTAPRLFRARLWLISQLWIVVLSLNMIAVIFSFTLPRIDTLIGGESPLRTSTVESIFTALAGSMITFTGIVFSAMFIAAQIQTSSYSPRLANQLRSDPIIMGTLVLSTATAAYSLGALASLGQRNESVNAPLFTVLFGLMLAIATLAWFAALVQRAFEKIQIGGILRDLSRRAWRAIDDVHPSVHAGQALPTPTLPTDASVSEIELTGSPGVIAAIDRGSLVKLADVTGGFIEVLPQVGEYVSSRLGAVRIYDGKREPTRKQVENVFVLSRQRTINQDPAFAIRILVDIAIRALSPAINDPTTSVQTIDRIESLLVRLYERHPGPTYVVDSGGTPRALIHAPTWIEYFELATTEIRIYGARSIQVHRRMRAMLRHLAEVVDLELRERVDLELELIENESMDAFDNPHDEELAREGDRFGIGGA
ncbi:MAG: DUF2254 domain-containing protein [Thermoleophilaceae bacterium]|nr:DUF2254 domain-containing protein [Thermoleophilaceae bacterium]